MCRSRFDLYHAPNSGYQCMYIFALFWLQQFVSVIVFLLVYVLVDSHAVVIQGGARAL